MDVGLPQAREPRVLAAALALGLRAARARSCTPAVPPPTATARSATTTTSKLIPSLRPLNPYGESKQQFDLWALAEERAAATRPSWAGFKFFNVYGFGERHKGKMASVILHAFDQIRAGGEVRLFKSYRPDVADGEQRRDFVYVDDVVAVLHFALEAGISRGIFNLGTGTSRPFSISPTRPSRRSAVPPRVRFIDMPGGLRARYQYATEARMERLRGAGYATPFTTLEDGARRYVAAPPRPRLKPAGHFLQTQWARDPPTAVFWRAAPGPELAPPRLPASNASTRGGFTMKHLDNDSGRVGYAVLYFMGVPIGLIIVLWVIFGNNLLTLAERPTKIGWKLALLRLLKAVV